MKNVKITFTDYFLNNFNGSQEELDAIVNKLKTRLDAGEFDDFLDLEEPLVIDIDPEYASEEHRILH